jgi:hypothetical protein
MGPAWAYAAFKEASTKMFDYLQAENPNWHVLIIHPGIIRSEVSARFGQESYDVRKYNPRHMREPWSSEL